MRIFNFIFGCYLLVTISLFFFSFTQVDLGLTLTEWSVWQVYQKFFQQIGFFNRPLSTQWYTATIILLFVFYGLTLYFAAKKKLVASQIWKIVLIISTILLFSYPAFSYDIYNYIFDAKIVTYYHQNPYEHKALDYPGDVMLSFMHWTHRTYPYGPFWLLLTIPLSFLGNNILLVTIMLFKALAYVSFLGTAYFIGKIVKRFMPQEEALAIAFFALNPLVIIEGLVSAHNDIFMMFLAVWGLYLAFEKKYFFSLVLLVLSIAVKFATVFLVPLFFFILFLQRQKKEIISKNFFYIATLSMIIPIVLASMRTNYQPWYLLYVLPFVALLAKPYFIIIPSIVLTLFSLLEYVPFFYLGNWDAPVPTILIILRTSSVVIAVLLGIFMAFRHRLVRKT